MNPRAKVAIAAALCVAAFVYWRAELALLMMRFAGLQPEQRTEVIPVPAPPVIVSVPSTPAPSPKPSPQRLAETLQPMYDRVFGTESVPEILGASGEISRATGIAATFAADSKVRAAGSRVCELFRQGVTVTAAFEKRQRLNAGIPHATALSTAEEVEANKRFFAGNIDREWRDQMARLRHDAAKALAQLSALEASAAGHSSSKLNRSMPAADPQSEPAALTQQDRERSIEFSGSVIAFGEQGCLIRIDSGSRPLRSPSKPVAASGASALQLPAPERNTLVVVIGLSKKLADGDRVEVRAIETGLQRGFAAHRAHHHDGTFPIFRAFPD